MNKDELRKEIKRRFLEFNPEELSFMSNDICSRLIVDENVISAKYIMAYYPLKDEVNILPFLNTAVDMGKTVLLPEVIGKESMQLRVFEKDGMMDKGALGTYVPHSTLFSDYEKIELVLVPGRAFDKHNQRLGRGGGYYDRFLEKLNSTYKLGVCFPFQIVGNIPVEQYDLPVDKVIY